MSVDYSTYAKTRKTSVRSIRAAAQAVLARRREAGVKLLPTDEDGDDHELYIDNLGGPIVITKHRFGIQLSISTTETGDDGFIELGERRPDRSARRSASFSPRRRRASCSKPKKNLHCPRRPVGSTSIA